MSDTWKERRPWKVRVRRAEVKDRLAERRKERRMNRIVEEQVLDELEELAPMAQRDSVRLS